MNSSLYFPLETIIANISPQDIIKQKMKRQNGIISDDLLQNRLYRSYSNTFIHLQNIVDWDQTAPILLLWLIYY